jgi:radical SAM protein with 4Fe4S-binding SPASM domain
MTEQYRESNGEVNRDVYKQIVRKTQQQHRLLSVQWELTYRCNERCTHCYLDVLSPGSQVPGELNTEEAKETIDALAELGGLTITFSGGEVFLRRDIFEIAAYARQKGFAIRFFTNGILIKASVADKIAAVKPVVVELSVYGSNAETHDEITQVPGSFDLTMRAIRLLLERNVRCIIKTPIMKENIEQVDELRQLAVDMGITFQYDLTIIPKHTGDVSPLKHRPSDEQLLVFLRERMKPGEFQIIDQGDDFSFCGIGRNSLTIDPYGEISTCVGARVSAGSLRQESLKEIWTESPVWEKTSNLTLKNLPVCSTCELRQFCVRCHGTAGFEDGDILGCSSVAYREARLRRQAYYENLHHPEQGAIAL